MARKGFRAKAREAVPKIFQTFNSLLGSIVRKKNATIVGPSKQLVGEFPEVSFERLYEFYHHWDQIKRSVDTMHQKLVGAGIEINTNNEYFNIDAVLFKTLKEFSIDAILEKGVITKNFSIDAIVGDVVQTICDFETVIFPELEVESEFL